MDVLASSILRMDANWVDYLLIALYFVFVLGIGLSARAPVSSSIDFFLSGRSLPAWVTGLAFISANLGAVEIMGMSANGAQYGMATFHYYWIGAIPAMLFLGVVMMPFYYGSKVRSVPEFMLRRFGPDRPPGQLDQLRPRPAADRRREPLPARHDRQRPARLDHLGLHRRRRRRSCSPTSRWAGCRAAIYNEVLQFFVIVAALLPLTLLALHEVGGWNGLKDKMTARAPARPARLLARYDDHDVQLVASGRSSASSSASASCCPSATGRPTSSRCSGRWPPRT